MWSRFSRRHTFLLTVVMRKCFHRILFHFSQNLLVHLVIVCGHSFAHEL